MVNYSFSQAFICDASACLLALPGQIEAHFSPNGAALTRLLVAEADGNLKNIALCTSEDGTYAGKTLGPVAGRIAGAVLTADGTTYSLCANEGKNTLHGGNHNLSLCNWSLGAHGIDSESAWLEFVCHLDDGVDGFPGNRTFTARYTLRANSLRVDYTARTDRTTFVNMSNHTYWNLSGDFAHDGYDQSLELCADKVLCNDTQHLPFAERDCTDPGFDFSRPTTLRKAMAQQVAAGPESAGWQLHNALGYNNGFRLVPGAPFAARLTAPHGTLRLTLTTDQPYLVVYSGGYLPVPGCALALEAQGRPGSTAPLLRPGETYRRFICFSFDTPAACKNANGTLNNPMRTHHLQ